PGLRRTPILNFALSRLARSTTVLTRGHWRFHNELKELILRISQGRNPAPLSCRGATSAAACGAVLFSKRFMRWPLVASYRGIELRSRGGLNDRTGPEPSDSATIESVRKSQRIAQLIEEVASRLPKGRTYIVAAE